MNKYIIGLLVLLGLVSCEKVINIDLNESNPKTVIESYLENDSTCYAKVSTTSSYYDNSGSPAITDATITISNQSGQSEILTHEGNGIYKGSTLIGKIGDTYTLEVAVGGVKHIATSTMPALVPIDSLTSEETAFLGPGNYFAYVNYTDPANTVNYYATRMTYFDSTSNETVTNYGINDDETSNGISTRTFGGFKVFEVGDTAVIELSSIDQATHLYFKTLQDAIGGAGAQSAAPGNPVSNLSNGALGYFGAWSKQTDTLIVTP